MDIFIQTTVAFPLCDAINFFLKAVCSSFTSIMTQFLLNKPFVTGTELLSLLAV